MTKIKMPARFGYVCDADTNIRIRRATRDEFRRSVRESKRDGGAGLFADNDGRTVYVEGGAEREAVNP